MNLPTRRFSILDSEGLHPMEWQQAALFRGIDLYEHGGVSTAVYPPAFNLSMGTSYIVSQKEGIPIEWFDPVHEEALVDWINDEVIACYENRVYLPLNHPFNSFDLVKDFIIPARRTLEASRGTLYGHEFVYKLTPEEETRILQLFLELNRYPHISAAIFTPETPYGIIGGYPGQQIIDVNPTQRQGDGYYNNHTKTMVISGWVIDSAIAIREMSEEVLHCYDALKGGLSQKINLSDMEKVGDFSRLIFHVRYRGNYPNNSILQNLIGDNTEENLRGLLGLLDQNIDVCAAALKKITSLQDLIGESSVFMRHTEYSQLDDGGKKAEFFAKLAKAFVVDPSGAAPKIFDLIANNLKQERIPSAGYVKNILAAEDSRYNKRNSIRIRAEGRAFADEVAECLRTRGIRTDWPSQEPGLSR